MACFLVPAAEAVITTITTKAMESREKNAQAPETAPANAPLETERKTPIFKKLKWLNRLLWGGSALLAFEHVWHGEVTPWFPFLTAAVNPADAAEMLREMATTGVAMSAAATAVWLGMVAVSSVIEKKANALPAKD